MLFSGANLIMSIEKSHGRWEIFIEQELRFGFGFGPVGITKKKLDQLSRQVFSYFHGQKIKNKIKTL